MALRQAVILCASFLGAFAASVNSENCKGSSGDQQTKDGYELLAQGVTFVLMNYSSTIPLEETVSCVRTTTTSKNDSHHTVMEKIEYKYPDAWQTLQQMFQFFEQGDKYNTMTPIKGSAKLDQQQQGKVSSRSDGEGTGPSENTDQDDDSLIVPPGNYTFIYTKDNCAVLKVELAPYASETEDQNSQNKDAETAKVVERDEEGTTTQPLCMLWVKKEHSTSGDCCEQYFQTHCSPGSPDYIGTGKACENEEQASPAQK